MKLNAVLLFRNRLCILFNRFPFQIFNAGINKYGNELMRKNNKYRNNTYNSQIYSLNYKFDSISSAGKISGTALDLIKRYNELAKEAQGNADYVSAENFRQYAEHYRKIVTEINERKEQRFNNAHAEPTAEPASAGENAPLPTAEPHDAPADKEQKISAPEEKTPVRKRTFKVIDISSPSADNGAASDVVTTVKKSARSAKNKAGEPAVI